MLNSRLILLLAVTLCTLAQEQIIKGTLAIKADGSQSQASTTAQVIAPIYSSQLNNINRLVVQVLLADPPDACTPLKQIIPNGMPILFLVEGGEGSCSYARKSQMAKKALARGIIIIDSPDGINNLNFRNTDSDRFITLLMNKDKAKEITAKKIVAQLTIDSTYDRNKASLQIWVSSLNRDSYNVLDWWGDIVTEISSLSAVAKWRPRFAYYACSKQDICGGEFVSSCACGGEFCSPEAHGMSSNVLVREDIRQHFIFQQQPTKYLSYVKSFKVRCLESYLSTKYVQDCSNNILQGLQLPTVDINNNIDLFLSSCDVSDGEVVQKLFNDMMLDRNKYRQIGHYPTIILNHQQLEFKNKDDLKAQICRKLSLEEQSGCVSESTTVMQNVTTWVFYFILIIILLGTGGLVVVFFRNRLRREMNKQLKMQVSTAVEHYFSLTQTNR